MSRLTAVALACTLAILVSVAHAQNDPRVVFRAAAESQPEVLVWVDSPNGTRTDSDTSRFEDLFASTTWLWLDNGVLLIRRGKAPRMGQWSLPGGAQSVGETVFETAVREVREETGLEVVPTGIVTVVDAITPDAEGRVHYHYTLVEVAAESAEGDPICADDSHRPEAITRCCVPLAG